VQKVAIHTDRRFNTYVLCERRNGIKTGTDECKECDYHKGTSLTKSINPFEQNWEVTCAYEEEVQDAEK